MNYRKAEQVLPKELVIEIQQYISGECLYIPIKEDNKTRWGSKSGYRLILDERDHNIYSMYLDGVSVSELVNQYFLSPKTIYRIISKMKTM